MTTVWFSRRTLASAVTAWENRAWTRASDPSTGGTRSRLGPLATRRRRPRRPRAALADWIEPGHRAILGLREDAVVESPDHPVALARGLLQPQAVENPDDAPPEGDQPGPLQRASQDRDGLAAHAQHLPHELLRH